MKRMILALLIGLTQVSPALAADRPSVIRIGVATVGTGGRPVSGWSFHAITAENGSLENEFKRDGIEIKWTYFSGAGPAVNEALANGQLDFAFEGDLPSLVARAGGLPTRVILAHTRFDPIYLAVPSDSPARSLDDLKGKRIAVFKGTNLHLALATVLARKGYKDSDFKIVNMSTFDGNAALLSKDIDGQISGGDLFALVQRGAARIIFGTAEEPELGRLSHLLVTEQFNAKYPETVQRVVNTVLKDAAWLADEANRRSVYQIWIKSGLSLPAYKEDWAKFKLGERGSPLIDAYFRQQYKEKLRIARELKLVRKDFDIDAWLDASYLQKGLQALNLTTRWKPQVAVAAKR